MVKKSHFLLPRYYLWNYVMLGCKQKQQCYVSVGKLVKW